MEMQGQHNSPPLSVAIIGRTHASEFRDLVRQIQNSRDLQVTGQFETIEDALNSGLVEHLPADLVVVLQAFSDEYSAVDAGQLIGRMLFRRVLCCYGPWCVSDGRTHEIWPVVTRVSVASAWSVLEQEVRNIQAGLEALLPMSAAEEVFTHRAIAESNIFSATVDLVLIVSDDRSLRETIAEILQPTAKQVFECGTSIAQVQRTLNTIRIRDAVQSGIRVLLDIDGQETRERGLIEVIRSKFPTSDLIRLTSFPQAVAENSHCGQVIDKLETATRLRA